MTNRDQLFKKEMDRIKGVMNAPKTSLSNVWFVNDEHLENFKKLVEKYKANGNSEYASACYVSSHPEIFYRINWSKSDSPIDWYFGEWIGEDENDPNGYHEESDIVGQLSSAYQGLIRAAVEMFTGSQYFILMDLLRNVSDEVYKVFIQAMEIRRNRVLIEME